MAAKEFIVAIELGSSKVIGIAGRKNLDGSISVLALAQEDSSSFIRKGVVYNIDKTAQCLTNIVKKLTTTLKTNISKVYVGVGGQSLRSIRNIITKELPDNTLVTTDMVINLMDSNRDMKYPEQEILDVAVQEYKVDSQLQTDPVGIQCNHLEGNFLNIIARNTVYRNLNKCFETAGITVAEMYMAPIALADSVLTEAEKRSGCALVDIGADTTTVSVFNKNILRHLAVIPLGGNNITKDIASLQMEESDAENMKIKYSSAFTDNNDIDNSLMLPIDEDRSVESRRFVEIVEGRLEEIIENVWFQIQSSDYYDKLLGGIILTGGGSNMKDIEMVFVNHTHIEKIRIAKFVTQTINSNNNEINNKNGKMNTILGILAKGDINCAGGEIDPNGSSLFEQHHMEMAAEVTKPRSAVDITPGVVRTEAEKQKAEEEKRKAAEEAARFAAEEAVRKENEDKEKRKLQKKNSLLNKAFEGLKKFSKKIVEDE
jgi:cell division protein FtsA